MTQPEQMLRGRIRAGEIVDHDLRHPRIAVVAQQHQRQLPLADGFGDLGRQCLKHDAPVDLTTQHNFFPRAALVDRAEHEVVAFALQRAHQAVDHFGVHAFEDPGVVGVEQADAVRAAAGESPRSQVRSVTHLAGESDEFAARWPRCDDATRAHRRGEFGRRSNSTRPLAPRSRRSLPT